jgi:hypothetical protein
MQGGLCSYIILNEVPVGVGHSCIPRRYPLYGGRAEGYILIYINIYYAEFLGTTYKYIYFI